MSAHTDPRRSAGEDSWRVLQDTRFVAVAPCPEVVRDREDIAGLDIANAPHRARARQTRH